MLSWKIVVICLMGGGPCPTPYNSPDFPDRETCRQYALKDLREQHGAYWWCTLPPPPPVYPSVEKRERRGVGIERR